MFSFVFLKVCDPERIRDRVEDHLGGRLDDILLEKIQRHPLTKKVKEFVVQTGTRLFQHFKKYLDDIKIHLKGRI